ncbi:MAG: hypothetical protein RIC03_00425 [Cyclobacteriaceae bacterium]
MRILTVILLIVLLSSCTTYLIPKSSLVEQLGSIDSTQLVNRRVIGPVATQYEYLANPITTIRCVDKNGQSQTLVNSPSIEMRVTETDNKKTIFYFDRTLIQNGQLIGVRSRFAPFVDKQIDLEDIQVIEIQDGQKNFKYAK